MKQHNMAAAQAISSKYILSTAERKRKTNEAKAKPRSKAFNAIGIRVKVITKNRTKTAHDIAKWMRYKENFLLQIKKKTE